MPHSRTDSARIQRTYTQLLQALTDLLTEKTFDEIRVTDLCEKAGVHRSTFYAHFEDKLQLLTFGIQELMEIFLGPPTHAPEEEAYQRAVHRVFKYFQKNQRMYTLLFLDPRNASAKALFRQKYIQVFETFLAHRTPQVPLGDLILYSRHFIGGLLAVVDWWLETDAQTPPDQMAAQFVRIIPNHMTTFAAPAE